ncbi:multiheme c-type cytochrome [Planctomycetota bacterium]
MRGRHLVLAVVGAILLSTLPAAHGQSARPSAADRETPKLWRLPNVSHHIPGKKYVSNSSAPTEGPSMKRQPARRSALPQLPSVAYFIQRNVRVAAALESDDSLLQNEDDVLPGFEHLRDVRIDSSNTHDPKSEPATPSQPTADKSPKDTPSAPDSTAPPAESTDISPTDISPTDNVDAGDSKAETVEPNPRSFFDRPGENVPVNQIPRTRSAPKILPATPDQDDGLNGQRLPDAQRPKAKHQTHERAPSPEPQRESESKPVESLDLLAPLTSANDSLIGDDDISESKVDPHLDLLSKNMYPSAKECGKCHEDHYREWSVSAHAYAGVSPMFNKFEQTINDLSKGTMGYFCMRCHAPVAVALCETRDAVLWESIPAANEGVTCIACHRVIERYFKANGERRIETGSIFEPVVAASNQNNLHEILSKKDHYKVKTSPNDKGPGQPIHNDVI